MKVLIITYKMDQISNDPTISHFLLAVKEDDRLNTLKQLILLGIHQVSSKLHHTSHNYCCCKCVKVYPSGSQGEAHFYARNQPTDEIISSSLSGEIEEIKRKVDQLVKNTRGQHQPGQLKQQQNRREKQREPKANILEQVEINGVKKQFRHHLDDSQVRKVLTNPYANSSPTKKDSKKNVQKMYLIQKQLDQKQIQNAKANVNKHELEQEKEGENKKKGSEHLYKKTLNQGQQGLRRTSACKYRDPIKVKSKIKSLVEKDKEKSRNRNQNGGHREGEAKYCQFEYSDEEGVESSSHTNLQCPVHSRFSGISQEINEELRSSTKRQYKAIKELSKDRKKRREQREAIAWEEQHQEDQVSQSSSFSKFSMASMREAGKIWRLKS